jgi:hypothetical protein
MNEATVHQKAYDAGVKVGLHPATAKQPTDLLWEQAKTGYDDETLVCYLNGIGDALAAGGSDLLKLPDTAWERIAA